MGELQEYKCPCCGGGIRFDSKAQKLKCPYCDTEFEIETLQQYDTTLKEEKQDDMRWDKAEGSIWQEGEEQGFNTYHCESCGGEIVADENTAASVCPFCGNPVVMTGKLSGALRPDLIIPFKLDKQAAKAGLMKHLEGKKLLPKIFKDQNHIDEIRGIYVPFWLFDTEADANIRYRGTRTRFWSDSRYDYTETSFYLINRGGSIGFEKVPVDGDSKIPDDLMESIEPFEISEAVAFQPAYLAGVLDIDASDKASRFIRFCDCFNIPIVTFEDVPGFLPGCTQEHNGIIRHGAKIVYAYAEATVPKITVITRKAYGGAYIVMNSKPIGADVNFSYPTAEIAVMGADGAVNILYRKATPEEKAKAVEEYKEKFSNPYRAAEQGYIDEIILPKDTRYKLIQALEMTQNKSQSNPPKKHGNMPL